MRKRRALAAMVMSFVMMISVASPAAAAGGFCTGQALGYFQIYVDRGADDPGVAGTYFEHVSGRTTYP